MRGAQGQPTPSKVKLPNRSTDFGPADGRQFVDHDLRWLPQSIFRRWQNRHPKKRRRQHRAGYRKNCDARGHVLQKLRLYDDRWPQLAQITIENNGDDRPTPHSGGRLISPHTARESCQSGGPLHRLVQSALLAADIPRRSPVRKCPEPRSAPAEGPRQARLRGAC